MSFNRPRKWWMRPVIRGPTWHDVRMACEHHKWAGRRAHLVVDNVGIPYGPQVGNVVELHRLAVESHGLQTRRDQRLTPIVVGSYGFDLNQVACQRYGWVQVVVAGGVAHHAITARVRR